MRKDSKENNLQRNSIFDQNCSQNTNNRERGGGGGRGEERRKKANLNAHTNFIFSTNNTTFSFRQSAEQLHPSPPLTPSPLPQSPQNHTMMQLFLKSVLTRNIKIPLHVSQFQVFLSNHNCYRVYNMNRK